RNIKFVAAERDPTGAATRSQHFVALHDLMHLPVALGTERGGEESVDRGLLRRRQLPEPEAATLDDSGREIGPQRPLHAIIAGEDGFRARGRVEGGEKGLGGGNDAVRCVLRLAVAGGGGQTGSGGKVEREQ